MKEISFSWPSTFVASVIGPFLNNQSQASSQCFFKLTLAIKRNKPCERGFKNGFCSGVTFCLRQLGRFERCVSVNFILKLVVFTWWGPGQGLGTTPSLYQSVVGWRLRRWQSCQYLTGPGRSRRVRQHRARWRARK